MSEYLLEGGDAEEQYAAAKKLIEDSIALRVIDDDTDRVLYESEQALSCVSPEDDIDIMFEQSTNDTWARGEEDVASIYAVEVNMEDKGCRIEGLAPRRAPRWAHDEDLDVEVLEEKQIGDGYFNVKTSTEAAKAAAGSYDRSGPTTNPWEQNTLLTR